MFVGAVMFVPMPFGLINEGEEVLALCMGLPISLLSLFTFISSLYKVKLTDKEISVTKYFQTKVLQWNEIVGVSLKSDGYGFYLKNDGESVKLFISNQVVNYEELVQQIERRRPDLFH